MVSTTWTNSTAVVSEKCQMRVTSYGWCILQEGRPVHLAVCVSVVPETVHPCFDGSPPRGEPSCDQAADGPSPLQQGDVKILVLPSQPESKPSARQAANSGTNVDRTHHRVTSGYFISFCTRKGIVSFCVLVVWGSISSVTRAMTGVQGYDKWVLWGGDACFDVGAVRLLCGLLQLYVYLMRFACEVTAATAYVA